MSNGSEAVEIMTAKEHMLQALTGMLAKGEALMHPICGLLMQGGEQRHAYFGLTKKYLLIALLSGTTVTHTIRVPLDIRSVKIKEKIFLHEHIIDINFNEGAPCRISASPISTLIDCQRENLAQFLVFLKSKTPDNAMPDLKQIKGTRVRAQYFNYMLYALIVTFIPMIPMTFILECKKQGVSMWDSGHLLWSTVCEMLPAVASFIVPLLLLSLGSKFLFGETIAVLAQDGMYLENHFIPWKNIKAVVYTPTSPSRRHFRYAHVTVTVIPDKKRKYDIDVFHFTLYGLRKLKKYLPEQSVRWAKDQLPFTIGIALLPTVIFLLMALIL